MIALTAMGFVGIIAALVALSILVRPSRDRFIVKLLWAFAAQLLILALGAAIIWPLMALFDWL